jgi:hypothetical protein
MSDLFANLETMPDELTPPAPISTGDNPPPAPPEDNSGDHGDDHEPEDRGDRPPAYFYPKTREKMPAGAMIQVGQRLHWGMYGGSYGIVYRIDGEQRPETIGTMSGIVSYGGRANICVVFDSGTKSNGTPESVVRGVQWEIYQSVATPEEIMDALDYAKACEAKREQDARDQAARDAAELAEAMAAEGTIYLTADEIAARGKARGAKRVIWAEVNENDSDLTTDYHNHKTTRRLVIGFATASRESFPALRKAAAMFPPTSHLAPGCDRWTVSAYRETPDSNRYQEKEELRDEQYKRAKFPTKAAAESFVANLIVTSPECQPGYVGCVGFAYFAQAYGVEYFYESFEHRENYSMGGGNFLKDGHDDADGWRVSSQSIDWLKGSERIQYFEPQTTPAKAYLAAQVAATAAAPPKSAPGIEITLNAEKAGIEIRFPAKPAPSVLTELKAHGWRWSRFSCCWYHRDTPTNRAYAEGLAGESSDEPQTEAPAAVTTKPVAPPSPAKPAGQAVAEKLRTKAESLTVKIDHLTRPLSQNATPKRLSQLQSRTIEGDRLRRVQFAFFALADLWERKVCPPILADVRSVSDAEDYLRTEIKHINHYNVVDTGEFRDTSAKGKALQELAEDPDHLARKRERLIQSELDKLRFCDIPGFFPTPPEVCRQVIDLAEIDPAHSVLEPSAGIGSLADACPNRDKVHCVEQWVTLSEILSMKGYHVNGGNFLTIHPDMRPAYDRIVMNPPFENGQDADHVRHAFQFLKPGGRLVAIVGAGILQRSDRKATEFREWLDEVGADQQELPEDAFNGRDAFRRTGTRAWIVVINR